MRFPTSRSLSTGAIRSALTLILAAALWGCNSDADVQTDIDSTGTGAAPGAGVSQSDTLPSQGSSGSATDGPAADPSAPATPNIRVTSPQPNATVPTGGFTLAGTARSFENSVSYRMRDAGGNAMLGGNIMAMGEMGNFNPYETKVRVRAGYTGKATLEVYQISAKDGSEIDMVKIPVIVAGAAAATDEIPLKIFFPNERQGSGNDCRSVYPIQRTVEKTQGTAEAALRALLEGPNQLEQSEGYRSEIPSGTQLNRIVIDAGTARADFSAELNGAAGSCRVNAIRSQIEQTLRQFTTVRKVVISVQGDAKTALQP